MKDSNFVPFTDGFDYEKRFYDVLLPNGEVVKHCWPNAGVMNAINGDGRYWTHKDNIQVCPSPDHPDDDHPNVVIVGAAPDKNVIAQLQALGKSHHKVILLEDSAPTVTHQLSNFSHPPKIPLEAFAVRKPQKFRRGSLVLAAAGLAAIAALPERAPRPPVTNHDLMRLRRAEEKRQRKAQKKPCA